MSIKQQWELGRRGTQAEIFVSPMDKGLIYVLIKWSSQLTLVLDTVFFKSEHADITANEIAKAEHLVARINHAKVINVKNWRFCTPVPTGAKPIAKPFLSEYAPVAEGFTPTAAPMTDTIPSSQPMYEEAQASTPSDYESYANQFQGPYDEYYSAQSSQDTSKPATDWQCIRGNLRSKYKDVGQKAVRRCFKKSSKAKTKAQPQSSYSSSQKPAPDTWKLGKRQAEVFVSGKEEGIIYVIVKWSEKLVLVHQHYFLKSFDDSYTQAQINDAREMAKMINDEGKIVLAEFDRCAPPKKDSHIQPFEYKYKKSHAA